MTPETKGNGYNFYINSIILAMILKILPLPTSLASFNPDWVLLILLYWNTTEPNQIGVINALVIGLLVDVLTGRLLGQYALAYVSGSYACIKASKSLQYRALLGQSIIIFLILLLAEAILLLAEAIIFWIENNKSPSLIGISFWLPVITGTIFWPLIYNLFNNLRFKE